MSDVIRLLQIVAKTKTAAVTVTESRSEDLFHVRGRTTPIMPTSRVQIGLTGELSVEEVVGLHLCEHRKPPLCITG